MSSSSSSCFANGSRLDVGTTAMTPVQVDDDDSAVGYFSIIGSNNNRRKMLALLPKKMMKMMTNPSPQSVEGLDDDDDDYDDDAGRTITPRATRSAMISRMLCDHLVTVNDDEIILLSWKKVVLPELDEFVTSAKHSQSLSTSSFDVATTCSSHTHFSSSLPLLLPSNDIEIATPSIPTAHKMLHQSVSSLASPVLCTYHDNNNNYNEYHTSSRQIIHLGPERDVLFYSQALGITISRHTDGHVRVLSVTPTATPQQQNIDTVAASSSSSSSTSSSSSSKVEKDTMTVVHRVGEIHPGDVVCNIGGVDLHSPIDTAIWNFTIGLVKMAIRPLKFSVASEVVVQSIDEERVGYDEEDCQYKYDNKAKSSPPHRIFVGWGRNNKTNDDDGDNDEDEVDDDNNSGTTIMMSASPSSPSSPNDDVPPPSSLGTGSHRKTVTATTTTLVLGPRRTVYFHEKCLGVKLRYNDDNDRRVYVVGVTPYRSFPNSPVTSTGDVILVGDIILEVRGGGVEGVDDGGSKTMVVWDLHDPIDESTWSNLIDYIRVADRPLCMIVSAVEVTTTAFACNDDGLYIKTTKLEQVTEDEVEEKEDLSKDISRTTDSE